MIDLIELKERITKHFKNVLFKYFLVEKILHILIMIKTSLFAKTFFKNFLIENLNLTNEFKDLIKIRMKMFKNKNSSNKKYNDLPDWTDIIRIENVFRQLDRTSLFIQQEKSIKTSSDVALFTLINNCNSWLEFKSSNCKTLNSFLSMKFKMKQPVFHSAYLVNGPLLVIKNNQEEKLTKIIEQSIKDKLSIIDIHNNLLKINGIGDFIAHQIIINLQLKNLLHYDESYVKLGPGSREGLRLLKLPVTIDSLNVLRKELSKDKELIKLIPSKLNAKAKQCELTLETVENCLCIFQKMKKIKDTGKTKRKYKSVNMATTKFIPEKWYN